MYGLVGVCLCLAVFLAANAAGSLATAGLWCVSSMIASPRRRAGALFALRLFPTAASLFATFVVFVPSFLAFEPRDTDEAPSLGLVLLAAGAVVLISAAGGRAFLAWHATRRLRTDWMRAATPFRVSGLPFPVFRIRHPFPVVSVVGVRRPSLFVASQVVEALSPAELKAAIAHEAGHVAEGDNLKSWVIRSCPDGLALLPLGRSLLRDWSEAAEAAADSHAARARARAATDLAAALLKVARLAPPGSHVALPASALTDGQGIAGRVNRLLATTPEEAPRETPRVQQALALLAASGGLGVIWSPPVLATVHRATEVLVRWLG